MAERPGRAWRGGLRRIAGRWTAFREAVAEAVARIALRWPLLGLAGAVLAGVVLWGGFNWSLELTNTEAFCTSCHVMRDYVYREYRRTGHYTNKTGVRATCPDCHVPKEWVFKVARKVKATNELYHWLIGSIATREKFEARRLTLARHVWKDMKDTDSRECRNCHGISFMKLSDQSARARTMHALGKKWAWTCIDCHKGVAHRLPRDFDREAETDALHERLEKEKVACKLCHEGMAQPPAGEGWN